MASADSTTGSIEDDKVRSAGGGTGSAAAALTVALCSARFGKLK